MSPSKERLLDRVDRAFGQSLAAVEGLWRSQGPVIVEMAQTVAAAFKAHRRLYLFGNGGSAADAQHLAAECINRFQMERAPLPAIALTVDTSVLTSIANDYDFNDVFLKQIQALGEAGDVALGLSTSGRSENVLRALRWAREHGLHTLGFAGRDKTDMDIYCDRILHVPSPVTARVQEGHIAAGHVLCELMEVLLFGTDGRRPEASDPGAV
ncbi:phosphoheptose isomerase [Desulfacinum hydrothermale DSM 13146]|uniref:Phosphoheptose isomerase n=1 Tax=Desulfacinum hydrothermale DSM 13146 TaxID=1121390 RepID=A0A1W1XV15_9BACT|nr:SIS domain-containing protein [Desulfacinum hydrothermale]SMC27705.1 phosphoheptose isomerase [Desulfacinum hydrothermale DSM 13146]